MPFELVPVKAGPINRSGDAQVCQDSLPLFAFLCSPFSITMTPLQLSSSHKTASKWAPFRARHKPLSALLPSGLRFLDAPLPAPLSPSLTVRLLPKERDTGLSCSAMCAVEWGRSCLFAGETTPVSAASSKPHSCSLTFWSSLTVSFGLSNITTFISSSLPLTLAPGPSSQTASTLTVTRAPRGVHLWATLSPELHTS